MTQSKKLLMTRIVAAVTMIAGAICIVTLALMFLGTARFSPVVMWALLAFSVYGIVAGAFLWEGKRWAYIAVIVFYAPQLILFASQSFQWQVWIGIQFYVRFTVGQASIGLNLFALLMLIVVVRAMRSAKRDAHADA